MFTISITLVVFSGQVLSLQETVQKECEERLELTESLTAARTELLQLKKPTGTLRQTAQRLINYKYI